MNPDQTAPVEQMEQSNLGPYYGLQYWLPRGISRFSMNLLPTDTFST